MTADQAETIALQALAWLAADPDRMGRFLAASGLMPAEIPLRAADPAFLAGVLRHLTSEEAWVIAFAADHALRPDQPLRALYSLPGQSAEEW
jgi:hypothetical protein